jgi:hypothetical protein
MQGLPNITDTAHVLKLLSQARHVAGWDLLALGAWCALHEGGDSLLRDVAVACPAPNLPAIAAVLDSAMKFKLRSEPWESAKVLVGRCAEEGGGLLERIVAHWVEANLWPRQFCVGTGVGVGVVGTTHRSGVCGAAFDTARARDHHVSLHEQEARRLLPPPIRGYIVHGGSARETPTPQTGVLYDLHLAAMEIDVAAIQSRARVPPDTPCFLCGDGFEVDPLDGARVDCVLHEDGRASHLYCVP